MTPKELVDITLDRARTDLLYDLERLEHECERPVHQVDNNLVECFKGYALNRLIKLCAQYRKGHRGESERKIIIGANTFYVFKLTANHTLVMDNLSPVELRWIPEDLEDILEHFAESLADSWTKVQEIVNDYWTMRKSGEIAISTAYALLKPCLSIAKFRPELHALIVKVFYFLVFHIIISTLNCKKQQKAYCIVRPLYFHIPFYLGHLARLSHHELRHLTIPLSKTQVNSLLSP